MATYVLLGSFGGSGPVVVGSFDDFDKMCDAVDIDPDERDEPEWFECARLDHSNRLIPEENYHRSLWDRNGSPWATKDCKRPKSWDDLKEIGL